MNKFALSALFYLAFVCFTGAAATPYKINDEYIDALFDSSTDITDQYFLYLEYINNKYISYNQNADTTQVKKNKQLIAGIIAGAQWITGIGWIIPIHRIYLGSKTSTYFLYCITLSGCGVLLVVDSIMLILDGEETQYIDNPKFIMW